MIPSLRRVLNKHDDYVWKKKRAGLLVGRTRAKLTEDSLGGRCLLTLAYGVRSAPVVLIDATSVPELRAEAAAIPHHLVISIKPFGFISEILQVEMKIDNIWSVRM